MAEIAVAIGARLGIDKSLAEIERGTACDPKVADACLRLFREKGYAIPAQPEVGKA